MYLASLEESGRAKSVKLASAAIAKQHEFARLKSPIPSSEIALVKKGLAKRNKTAAVRRATPLTVEDLAKMRERTDPKNIIHLRNFALVAIMFAAFLRRSEVVRLRLEDLQFEDDGVLVHIRESKTDQHGKGATVGVARGQSKTTCPVRALEQYIGNANIVTGWVFRMCSATSVTKLPMSANRVNEIIKDMAAAIGRDSTSYSSHSARRGGASTAAIQGMPLSEIQDHGRWKSEAVKSYIVKPREKKFAVSKALNY